MVIVAISGLQRRGLIVTSVKSEEEAKKSFQVTLFWKSANERNRDSLDNMNTLLTFLHSKLFHCWLIIVKINYLVARWIKLFLTCRLELLLQERCLAPNVFSDFYVNMVKAGEESGKLTQVFLFFARSYFDRQYALTSKTKASPVPSFRDRYIRGGYRANVYSCCSSTFFYYFGKRTRDTVLYKNSIWCMDFLVNYGILFLIFYCYFLCM